MANVQVLGNGLRSVFTKVETSEQLHGLMLLFWDIYDRGRYADAVLSALFETVARSLSVTDTKIDWKEYKINFVSSGRMDFRGLDFKDTYQEESDVIAQVRWLKGEGFEEAPAISETSPVQLFRTLGALTGLGRPLTLKFLEEYAKALYEKGARITHLTQQGQQGTFMLIMRYEDVSVKLIVYVPDYLNAQYYHAHRTKGD